PFSLAVTGGPLLNIDRNKPYPFNADLRASATYLTARGAVPKPFDLGHFYMVTSVRGPDLANIYPITGIALPNTPPYALHGRVSRDDKVWRVTGLSGRVGDSDLAGTASVTLGGQRPLLKADLTTRSLDFDDLGAVFGGAPSTKAGETASPDQKVLARTQSQTQRLMPDATLKVDRFRSMDADVTFKALSIRDAPIHLKAASAKVKLDAGLLRAEPLELDLPQGRVSGYVQLDARKRQPVTDLDLRLSNGRLEQLVPVSFQGWTPYSGSLVGRARLTGTGDSVHKAFANANGEVMLVAPGGEIRTSIAQLMGVNVIKGLGLLFAKDKDTTPIRCGVAHFQARNGLLSAGQIVFDTGPVLVTGKGAIDMDTERLDFRLQGHPKKIQLVRLILPVKVEGTLLKPKIGVEAGKAIGQGGVAVALATLLTPLAVVLPFVDSGLAKDANCAALLADGAAEGAPVKSARVAVAKAR
ncbi:MAG: AsmA family protein, partial [Phenylobacterium sp.]